MNMKLSIPIVGCLSGLLVLIFIESPFAVVNTDGNSVTAVTEFSYASGPDEGRETALALTLYGAKHKAVTKCAQRLVAKGLLDEDIDRRMEIICLVNHAAPYRLLESSFDEASHTCNTDNKCQQYR